MHTVFYLWVTILSLTGIWALWTYGFRKLILDWFCFGIGNLLICLDEVASTGCLPRDSRAYKEQKAILEAMMQVAPRFGLLQLLLSHSHVQSNLRDTEEDPSKNFELSIASLQPYAQEKLRWIRDRMTLLTLRFVLLRNPVWTVLGYLIFFVGYITGKAHPRTPPADVLQREAYVSGLSSSHDEVLA